MAKLWAIANVLDSATPAELYAVLWEQGSDCVPAALQGRPNSGDRSCEGDTTYGGTTGLADKPSQPLLYVCFEIVVQTQGRCSDTRSSERSTRV